MALANTNTSPILEEGTNITFTVTDQVIKIDATSSPSGAWLLDSGGVLTANNILSGNFNVSFTGTGLIGLGVSASTAKLRVRGLSTGTGTLVLFEDSTPTARFTLLENGQLTLTGASGIRPLTISAVSEIALRISNSGAFATIQADGANTILNGQTSSAGTTNSRGYFTNRIDGGNGSTIVGSYWSLIPNSNTSVNTALAEEFGIKPGDGSSNIVGGKRIFKVYTNSATPIIETGFEWEVMPNAGTSSRAVTMRLRGNKLAVGSDFTPSATVDILEGTLGNAVLKYSSTATNDAPGITIYQNRVTTTDATVTTLHSFTTATDTAYHFEAIVLARRTGGTGGTTGDMASYKIIATFKNIGGTVTQVGTTTIVHSAEDQAGWDCVYDINGTAVRVRVTGALNNNLTWHLEELKVASLNQ